MAYSWFNRLAALRYLYARGVQSPNKGFACLIYLHRHTKDNLNLVLNNYFRSYLQNLEARQEQVGLDQLNQHLTPRERAPRNEVDSIDKIFKECRAWERETLLPLAQQRIYLDLDEGVKLNYSMLGSLLTSVNM